MSLYPTAALVGVSVRIRSLRSVPRAPVVMAGGLPRIFCLLAHNFQPLVSLKRSRRGGAFACCHAVSRCGRVFPGALVEAAGKQRGA